MLFKDRHIPALILVFLMTAVMAGCNFTQENKEPEMEMEVQELKLYYVLANNQDEMSEESDLILHEGELIEYPKPVDKFGSREEMDSYKYNTAVSMLNNIPNDLNCKADVSTVTKNIEINNIVCKDGVAYVDVKGENLYGQGGSDTEILYISQIVETLIDSFSEIKKVKFLVDGKESETLMGHCDISEAFKEGLVEKIVLCE